MNRFFGPLTPPKPGEIVRCRDRQWVVVPAETPEVLCLRPLDGNESETCGIHQALWIGGDPAGQNTQADTRGGAAADPAADPAANALDRLEPDRFPQPTPDDVGVGSFESARLLADAVRLNLRSGAGPFRCLGRLSVRLRPYQVVPLLMALRQETVRLLIADDVGIGKTIEAGVIVRELLDRREIDRMAVLCPPQLCDQWRRELQEKFHIEAVVVRSGTVSQLERQIPGADRHVFEYYRHLIVSLDYVKSDRRRAAFLAHCPDCIVVDEAHTCTQRNEAVQQRYQLVSEVAAKTDRHLILLSATPHSGIEQSFSSLIGLLKPDFAHFDLDALGETQRAALADCLIQRRRADVRDWLGQTTPFPVRHAQEEPYGLSPEYRVLFDCVYDLARGLVQGGESLSHAQRQGRYWSALAIVRCVMSSPAAAVATLERQSLRNGQRDRHRPTRGDGERDRPGEVSPEDAPGQEPEALLDEALAIAYVDDPSDHAQATDLDPGVVVQRGQQAYSDRERKRLRELVALAKQLRDRGDQKLARLMAIVRDLLAQGSNPIIWCRYIATAKYVAAALQSTWGPTPAGASTKSVRVVAVHGEQTEEERESHLADLAAAPQRILVATDCLSEGVNLQAHFSAVVHYDLPWNPNRLEQREGRVDRYGQTAERVPCVLLFGQDNPVDGAVLEVLIRKAVRIHQALGIMVPVPMDSDTVSQAIFASLFEHTTERQQLSLFAPQDGSPLAIQQRWERAVERETRNRTRFAQRRIKPEEVERELVEVDRALGREADVARFVRLACEHLHTTLRPGRGQTWQMPQPSPELQAVLGEGDRPVPITFVHPAPAGVTYLGRNHPWVEALGQHIFQQALMPAGATSLVSRCNCILTEAVSLQTVLLLLRLRHRLYQRRLPRSRLESTAQPPQSDTVQSETILMAEECLVWGFAGRASAPQWLPSDRARLLLETAQPVREWPLGRQRLAVQAVLDHWEGVAATLAEIAIARSRELETAHNRVRQLTQERRVQVEPIVPMDVIGLYVLNPP